MKLGEDVDLAAIAKDVKICYFYFILINENLLITLLYFF